MMLTDGLVGLAAFGAGGLLAFTATFCLRSPQLLCSWIYANPGGHADGSRAITESVSMSVVAVAKARRARRFRRAINEPATTIPADVLADVATAMPSDVLADVAQMAHTFGPATFPVLMEVQPWSQRVRKGGRIYGKDELVVALDELARMGFVHKTSTFSRKEAGYSCHPANSTEFYNALRKGDLEEARRWS